MRVSEPQVRRDSRLFEELCEAVLRRGNAVQFRVNGESMKPNLLDGDDVVVAPASAADLRRGDVVLAENFDGLRVHRVNAPQSSANEVTLRSDSGLEFDPPSTRVFGKVVARSRGSQQHTLTVFQTRFVHPLRVVVRRASAAAKLRLRRLGLLLTGIVTLSFVCATFFASAIHAQADLSLTQTPSVTAVATSTNYTYTETVTNNGPNAAAAGTIVVYQQTPPNATFRAIAATNWTCTNASGGALTVGYTGPIICTFNNALAVNAATNSIVVTEQIAGGTAAGTAVLNSATVTSSTTVDPVPSNNTAVSTILVEPVATADLAISMTASPTPAFVSSTLTYTIAVQNLGQATLTSVANLVQDTLPASASFVSSSAPSGWSCAGTATVQCSLTGSFAMGQTATFTITVTTPAGAAALSNTAQINLATDPNPLNNSATVVTVVQPLVCATPGNDGAGGRC